MSQESSEIKCPHCGEEIDVNEALSRQYEEELRKQEEELRKQYDDQLAREMKENSTKLEHSLKEKIEAEQAEQIQSLQDELNEKSKQVRELNEARTDVERLKREKEELKGKLELEAERKLNKKLREAKEEFRKTEQTQFELELSTQKKIVNDLKKQLQDAQRKAEQGSQQLQGEVQELAIEEWLTEQFPQDTIQEIKKGQRGADCLQIVNNGAYQNCGSIYYESKRTKAFQPSWIGKFKDDIQEKNANIGVLVTEAMPKGMDRLGLKEGIWICSFDEFKGLCTVLRESVIQIGNAIGAQENKGDKMNMLYGFLTSNEFRLQIEAIVAGFTQMQSDLEREKRSMHGLWKKREKQIDNVLLNTSRMYHSIKGIAGDTVQTVPLLELSSDDGEDAAS